MLDIKVYQEKKRRYEEAEARLMHAEDSRSEAAPGWASAGKAGPGGSSHSKAVPCRASQEAEAAYDRAEASFYEEEGLWETELLKLAAACGKAGSLPVLQDGGTYRFEPVAKGCPCISQPDITMDLSTEVDAGAGTASLTGWDGLGEDAGHIRVRISDLNRDDRDAFFRCLARTAGSGADGAMDEADEHTARQPVGWMQGRQAPMEGGA